jgi:hypothetical protein
VGASDVNIPRVVARVGLAEHCFAKLTAGANVVNIPTVVARVLRVLLCFAKLTAVASDVNIPRVVISLRNEVGCAAVTAAKLGCTSSPLLLEHSAGGEEPGEWAELRVMRDTDKLLSVKVKGGGISSKGSG